MEDITGGDTTRAEYYQRRWDNNLGCISDAIKHRRNTAVSAISSAYSSKYNHTMVEWDSEIKANAADNVDDPKVPDYDILKAARIDNHPLYAEFMEKLVVPAKGKLTKGNYGIVAMMNNFNSINLTPALESFVLWVVKDKQAVWREHIGLGQKKRTTSAKPTFTVSGRFVQKGVGFSRASGNLYINYRRIMLNAEKMPVQGRSFLDSDDKEGMMSA